MKTLLAVLTLTLFTFTLVGQTPAPASPANFFSVGANYDAFNSPHLTGGASYAHRVSDAGGNYPTYALTDIAFQTVAKPKGAIQTIVSLGVAQTFLNVGNFSVLAIGAAGVATGTSAAVGDFSGGGAIMYRLPKSNKFFDHVLFIAKAEKNAPTGTLGAYAVRFGKTF